MPVAKTVVNAKTGKRRNHKVAKKVKKTRSFLSKRAGFVVDDTGLEPVTSRTSTPKDNFLQYFSDIFTCFRSRTLGFRHSSQSAFPCVPRLSVAGCVVRILVAYEISGQE